MKSGLTEEEVIKNRQKYGSNALENVDKVSFLKKLLESLGDPIIRILIIALGIKTVFLIKDFDWYETVGIVIAIFIASFISTISEYGSEQAFKKLQMEASKIKCRVKRNNEIKEIPIKDVVVNDLVLLETGDKIPADGYLVEGEITVDESSLTGETKEVKKTSAKNQSERNKLLRGSVVYSKVGIMIVTEVGSNTIYGKLAKEVSEKSPDSPLKLRLRHLAKIISYIGYVGAFLVSVSYLFSMIVLKNNFDSALIKETMTNFPLLFGYILHALTLSVTIIVVAVPEGLPMMITLVLSSNMKRMLKNNVLVRKLVGIETAGSLNILFTDKTGTLTKGKLEVTGFVDGELKERNHITELNAFPRFKDVVLKSIYYNNSSHFSEGYIIGGNSTDKSILKFIRQDPNLNYQTVSSEPFDSKKKYSKVTIEKDGKREYYIKGAFEILLPKCNKYYHSNGSLFTLNKNKIKDYLEKITKRGIRVILLANSLTPSYENLNLIGILLIKDEVREEAKNTLELIEKAHIQTVMITGDNRETALSIASEVGLYKDGDIILTHNELENLSDIEIKNKMPKLKVVARALPQDKSRLVKIASSMGLVVGMTGDGVNDAPALKKADIGFAMGSGTEVAKEASDIVILDDNIKSIAASILYGRTIFKSIRKFIIFQLTVNICAVSLSIIGPFIGVDTPVTVIQMLWVNMVMDTLAGLAFSFEPPLLEYMNEKPKKKMESILNKYMIHEIVFTGLYSSFMCVFFLKSPFIHHFFRDGVNDEYFMTAFFGLFIFISIFNAFNARTVRINLLANLFKNKVFLSIIFFIAIVQLILIYFGGELFRTAGLTLKELEIMILIASTVIPVDWLRKYTLRKRGIVGGV